jgi:tRNA A-37 threonylcarbamoyl transferase component Bud32
LEFLKNVSIGDKQLGKVMSPSELEQMAISLDRATFEAGQKILIQGNTGDEFFIILDGSVSVYVADKGGSETKVATLSKGDYFGEKALLSSDVRGATCIADSLVTCLTLERDEFLSMFGSFDELLNKDPNATIETAPPSVDISGPGSFALDISLSDLDIRATLGIGAFGRVKLCRYNAKDQYYALKCQSKKGITESGLQEHVLQEMRIMRRIDHPYIARLFSALQDSSYIYFVLELLQGGELFTHLRNRGKLSEQSARFYGATVVYAFTTLHAKKIAYRDLKPENLVMDANGFVKLVDFGLAKQLLSGKTWTLCGTPDYLAPEIILNEGHDLAVDYWALGVLLYEMVVGAPPFYAEDPMEVYEKILSGNPSMPSFFTRNLSDLIKKLLRSQQAKRLGNTRGGTASVVKHKWFSTFEWALLESGEAKPPHKPNISSREDVANFDQFDEGEQSVCIL